MSMVKTVSPLALSLIAGAALSLVGCSKEDSSSAAIHKAAATLNAVSGGGATPATNAAQQKQYDDAAKISQGVSGSPAQNSAASLISATAQAGKASVPSTAASTSIGGAEMVKDGDSWRVSEIGLINRMRSLRTLASRFVEHKQAAAAAMAFKPGDQVTALDQSAAALDKLIVDRSAAKADLESKITDLAAKAKAKADQAAVVERQAGELRSTVTRVSATEGARIVEQASALKRSADKLRLEAQLIDADAAQYRAQLPELQLAVAQIEAQKKGIAQTKADLQTKLTESAQVATKSDGEATKVAAAIDAEVNELKKARDGAWARSNDERLGMLRQALSAAQKVGSDSALQSKLSVGAFQQAIGDVQLSRAVEARTFAIMMNMLAASDPALPNSAAYKTEAQNADKQREEAAGAAKAAYEAAKSAFASAQVRGGKDAAEVKARLEKVGKSMDSVIEALVSGSNSSLKEWGYSDAPSDDAPKPDASKSDAAASKPTAPAPAAASAPPELTAAFENIVNAAKGGDWTKVTPFCQATTPLAQQAMQVAGSMAKLDAACKTKFGKTFSQALSAAGMSSGVDMAKIAGIDPKSVQFEVDGEKAAAKIGGGNVPMRKVGDAWKLDIDAQLEPAAANPMVAGMFSKMGPIVDSLTADVESGKIGDLGALQAQFMAKIMGGAKGAPEK